jgi:predicted nucleic acid-binding protein
MLPQIRARHGWSDDELLRFLTTVLANAVSYREQLGPASIARDITDAKFLGLAQESGADYLVTKDNRHLLRLGRYQRTRIVTPAQFLKRLP